MSVPSMCFVLIYIIWILNGSIEFDIGEELRNSNANSVTIEMKVVEEELIN